MYGENMITETTEKCTCDWCTKRSPTIDRIRESLTDEAVRKEFDELIDYFMNLGEDCNVNEAKLAGDWPGWEWMKEEKEKRRG
jgi:hypothetical protein